MAKQFFIEFRPGEASIFRQISEFRYITCELATGDGPPDSVGMASLKERGFLKLVDFRSRPANIDSLRSRVEDLGLSYASAKPEEFAAQVNDPHRGIVLVFGDNRSSVDSTIKTLAESGVITLTACEWDLLFQIVR